MREQQVGSVVVVDDDDRAIGILTERDLVRIAAAGSDASTAKVSEWMTAEPDSVASRRRGPRQRSPASPQHGYRHIPVVDGDKLVGIVSMRDLMRIAKIQPAEAPRPRDPEGPRRRRRRRDRRRRRARPRRLLPLPPVQTPSTLAETRPLEDVWHLHVRRRAAGDERRARGVRGRGRARCARSPTR